MNDTVARTTTVDAAKFKQAVFVRMTIHRWGNRCKITDREALAQFLKLQRTQADEDRAASDPTTPQTNTNETGAISIESGVTATKRLIKSPALDAVNDRLTLAKKRILAYCVPSTIQPGMMIASPDSAERIQAEIEAAESELGLDLLSKLDDDYAPAIERARTARLKDGGLGPLFQAKDYPNGDDVRKAFGLNAFYWQLKVAENLPAEMLAAQQEKLEKTYAEAAESVTLALRESIAELIKHATDKLSPKEDGKKQIFRDSLIGNVQEFIDAFAARNIMNDTELAGLVDRAKQVLTGIKGKPGQSAAEVLRTNEQARENTRQQFADIATTLDGMIQEQRERAFSFDEE